MHAAARQAHLELYMGLVETGVGLIPGGGGCKEMLLRVIADADRVKVDARGESAEIVEGIRGALSRRLRWRRSRRLRWKHGVCD